MAENDEAKQSREEFMALARKRFEAAADDERAIRQEAEKDLRFVAGDQWDEKVRQDRLSNGRPALTFSRCHTFVQQVSNEGRQNKPQIKFVTDDDAFEETAEVFEGLARHIQYDSDAQIAYETALEYSAGGSFGYYRFLTEYCDDESFDLDLKVVPVVDPFSVYGILIPSCFNLEPKHAFVVEELPLEEYKRQYGDSELARIGFDQGSKRADGWVGTDTVRVAEYWYVEEKDENLIRIKSKSGNVVSVFESKLSTLPAEFRKGTTIIGERPSKSCEVKFCKINGLEVLEGTETTWPGYCIPIIPVLGKQLIVGGKPQLFSVVRFQRDPQQLINFYKTRIAETLGTAPIQPYMVVEGQIAGHEVEWSQLNTKLRPYLTYRNVDVAGKPAGPPTRQVFEPPIQSLSAAAMQEIDDMKATSGIFDASLGARSNENSGLAIARRQQQSNVTNMHFMDNLERAFKKGGVVLQDVIPKIYDAPRMVRILGADETPKIVKVNQLFEENGKSNHYKLNELKGHVIVTMGRAFSTKRMESFDMMTQVLQANPQLLNVIGDIFFRNSDVAGSDQLADRFKKMLPPQLQEEDQSDPETQVRMLAANLQQMKQAHDAINAYAQQLEKEKEGKVIEQQGRAQIEQLKAQTQVQLEQMKIEAQVAIAEITSKYQNERERMKLEADLNAKLHVSAHELALQADQQAHEVGMAGVQHDQALEQQSAQAAMAQQQAEQQPTQD